MGIRRLKAYFASPLFNDIECGYNLMIAETLALYVDVFLPQRDGLLLKNLVAEGIPITDARSMVFQQDINHITETDLLVANLDGRTIDEGVAFELGYARALGKFCIGLKTDDRIMLSTGDNPMIVSGCHQTCTGLQELILAIQAYARDT